jgi:hypothetical protein
VGQALLSRGISKSEEFDGQEFSSWGLGFLDEFGQLSL